MAQKLYFDVFLKNIVALINLIKQIELNTCYNIVLQFTT